MNISNSTQARLDSVLAYLAGRGITLTEHDQAELLARIDGHADAAARATYPGQAEQYFVRPVDIEAIDTSGNVMDEQVLTQPPVRQTPDKVAACGYAQAFAQDVLFAVHDGNGDIVLVTDVENDYELYYTASPLIHRLASRVHELADKVLPYSDTSPSLLAAAQLVAIAGPAMRLTRDDVGHPVMLVIVNAKTDCIVWRKVY